LLADFLNLTPSGTGGRLCLLGLLLGLGSGLLLLALFDSGSAGGVASFRTLGAALLDHIEGGTNNGALVLDGAARTLLGNFLFAGRLALLIIEVCRRDVLHPRHVPLQLMS
jgi:hypothetical protein